MGWLGLFGALGMVSISICLFVVGSLSRRLGRVTKAKAYFVGFYISAGLVLIGAMARLYHLGITDTEQIELSDNVLWVMLYNGAPALGITLGLVFAWRYWSWLLAERN